MRPRQIASVALVLGLSVAGFIVARVIAERDARSDSEHRAEVAAAQIRGRIQQAASLTESLRRFMLDASGTGATSDQFARNALRWLSPSDLSAAAWVERIGAADRAAYERRLGQPIVTPDERRPVESRRSYLPATLVSGFYPMALPGTDLSREPGMATALRRAARRGGVAASRVARPGTGTSGLFLVAPAPNLVEGALHPGYVVVFVPDRILRADTGARKVQITAGGTATEADAAGKTVTRTFTAASQRFAVTAPEESVSGPAEVLPWIILAAGIVLAALAAALAANAARRAKAQGELDRIFTLSSDVIAVADFNGHFTRVNPAGERILGYSEAELLARPYLEFIHPDDRERSAAEAAAVERGSATSSFENRFIRKDGSYRVLEWTATPVVADGVVYAMGRDVTERRQAETEVERLADEQAALRRVATVVAGGASELEVFTAIAEEIGHLLGTDEIRMVRYENDRTGLVVASSGDAADLFPVGTRLPLDGDTASSRVFRTGQPVRVDDIETMGDPVAVVATPIFVEGRLWGAMTAGTTEDEPFPPDMESRLGQFTELMGTAIANATAHAEVERLADEQAALRRVATLVAQGVRPAEIFSAVGDEVSRLFDANPTGVVKFDFDDPAVVFVGTGGSAEEIPLGTRWELADGMVTAEVYRTGRSARLDALDWSSARGSAAATARSLAVASSVGSPIVVEDHLWGAITVSGNERLPLDTGERLEKFTELVATAIANAESRSELAASRRRLVAASDEARRRIERDLHDGTQQRLVSLGLELRAAEALVPPERNDIRSELSKVATGLAGAVEDLRELTRGIHPAILSEGGLAPALRTLARRSTIPVELDVRTHARLPQPVEAAAYYVASEALANAIKHAHASRIRVRAATRNGSLLLSIRDDGVGGADPSRGSGLLGLADRVEALDGSIRIRSATGAGTEITAELPLP